MSRDWMATLLHSVLLAVRNVGVVTAIQNPPIYNHSGIIIRRNYINWFSVPYCSEHF